MLKIYFWSKDSGNMLSHGKGLTPEQVQELKQVKEGDRLVLWFNGQKKTPTSASYTLKIFQPKGDK